MKKYKYNKKVNKFTENGHTMFEEDVLKRLERLADLEEQIKQGELLPKDKKMPLRLTAENGAKSLLSGEFFEYIEVINEEYCGCGECDYCIEIQDEDAAETNIQRIPVSWDTIKEIYLTIVDHYHKSE